jgi:hypothetical protein
MALFLVCMHTVCGKKIFQPTETADYEFVVKCLLSGVDIFVA